MYDAISIAIESERHGLKPWMLDHLANLSSINWDMKGVLAVAVDRISRTCKKFSRLNFDDPAEMGFRWDDAMLQQCGVCAF